MSQASQNSGPDVAEHIRNRADDLDALTPSESFAINELQALIQKNIDTFEAKQDFIVTESNQYERQYTSFFSLAISFIIAGLLSAMPDASATISTKIFYSGSIISALIAAAFLFLEYKFASNLYDKWLRSTADIINYINTGNWKSPNDLHAWIANRQSDVPRRSTSLIFKIEATLIFIAFTFSALWLIESLFNPDWLWFV